MRTIDTVLSAFIHVNPCPPICSPEFRQPAVRTMVRFIIEATGNKQLSERLLAFLPYPEYIVFLRRVSSVGRAVES
jgi:hypothetical protein